MRRKRRIGIVGHAEDKFNIQTRELALQVVHGIILSNPGAVIVSGGCHLGGVDKYAEYYADLEGRVMVVHLPKKLQWSGGYRERNLKIARDSDEVHVVVVEEYPVEYKGRRFKHCYHCSIDVVPPHRKSGACWTARKAIMMGKPAYWHIIQTDGTVVYHVERGKA